MRQPICDESGVGFGTRRLAENSTLLWSNHSILRNDETWPPEWSGNLGGVQHGAIRSRVVSWGTVPSLDDWEKDWQENPQRSRQPKLLLVDFQSPLAAIAQTN